MDNLKDYIEKNRGLFTESELPEGDTERFLSKLDRIKFKSTLPKRRISLWKVIALPIAAMLTLFFSISLIMDSISQKNELLQIYAEYCNEVVTISGEIEVISGEDPSVIRVMDNITFEAIPFAQQLPEEMTEKEKVKVMKEYYSQKLAGLRYLKTLVSESRIETE